MATPVQTAQMIRLAFQTMAADNAHHSFESMCRHVAMRRIASNVLPATGPVSAGGDQGRDFETFRTYLADELPFALGFLAMASADVVVFACTIQREGLRAKFEGDISSICAQGTHVDRIYIFATENVPTRLRHDLQEWAAGQHDVALEIIDGSALAEWLAEPELYWIAQEYLHLPAELAPQAEQTEYEAQLPSWYVELRAYWQEPGREPANLGDMFDLRHGLRHAIPPGPARADLAGWLALMTRLAERSPNVEARLHAIYEIVAARARGTADLRAAEPLVRLFIGEVQDSDDPTLLFDASVLTQFCVTAARLGHTDIPMNEAASWIPLLRRHVDQLMEQDWGPNTRAGLLQVAAHLALHIDYTDTEAEGSVTLDDVDRVYDWAPDAGNLERHPHVTEAMEYQGFTVVIAEQTRPEFVPTIHGILGGGLFDGFTHPHATSPSAALRTEQEWTDWLSDKAGAPFSDVGPRRAIAFHALGVRWIVHARNEQDTVLAMEDFTSTMQILLAEFASLDPVLVPQDVDIEIRVYQPDQRPGDTYLTRVNDGERLWLLLLPAEESVDASTEEEIRIGVLHLAFQVLIGNSLLDQQRFSDLMDQAARNGLFSNLEIGRPYRELVPFRSQTVPLLAEPQYRPLANTQHPNPRAGAPQMRPRTGPGPGYSTDRAHTILAERYEILPISIKYTIPTLLSDPHVCNLFRELRNAGWKDWHLLNVMANLTINHRLVLGHGTITTEKARQMADAFRAEALRAEQPDDPQIASDQITRASMEQGVELIAVSSLHNWSLTLHHSTTDTASIMQLLAERYRFWDDDIAHPDPFHGLLLTPS